MVALPTPDDVARRQAAVDRILAAPPVVHYMSREDQAAGHLTGVWSTDESCYRFLATRCVAGSRTLETGSGISTVLFTAWGARHTCITPGQEEADAVVAYCVEQGIATDRLHFEVTRSDQVLPKATAESDLLDIVLIDGCHGFPAPMIDWYYGAGRLRKGGVVVVDDLHLAAVHLLDHFLQADPRWRRVAGTAKWVAYERASEGSLSEDWFDQTFYTGPDYVLSPRDRIEAAGRRVLRPVKRAVLKAAGRTKPSPRA